MAKKGNSKAYPLPLPMARREDKNTFSYSGLKTAFYRLISAQNSVLSPQNIYDLAAGFQNRAFEHLVRVTKKSIGAGELSGVSELWVGGGVAANIELRKRLRKMGRELNLQVRFPYSVKLVGDNAAMIGVAAGLRLINHRSSNITHYEEVDRRARWPIDQDFSKE